MVDGFVWTFPVYSLLPKAKPGPLLLTAAGKLFIPLFTDADAVRTYLDRSTFHECRVAVLMNVRALVEFLKASRCPSAIVMVDPIDPSPGWRQLFDRRVLIAELERRR